MFKTKEQIKQWLDEMGVINYVINKDLTVDVKGSVNLSYKNLKELPVQFGKVGRSFDCYNNQLKSLKGAPQKVGRDFLCHNNQLKSVPKWIENIENVYVFENLNWNNVEWINKILGDKLTAEEVFAIDNIEHRRVAYQYMDKVKMKQLKDYKILDTGTDEKGNPVKIVSFTIQNMKEPLLFYNCICPSSGREYFVQTEKKTWKEAKASSFGFFTVVQFLNEW